MARTSLSSIVHRAVLLHLSLAAPGLVACSESPASTEPPDAGIARDTGADAAPCRVLSSTPIGIYGGSCRGWAYAFNGTPTECTTDAGLTGTGLCAAYCPPPPAEAGLAAAGLSYCTIGTCGNGFPDCTSPGVLACSYDACSEGRRPAGLRRFVPRDALGPVPRFLARMAHLEAASVIAFDRLAQELEAHGAPGSLHRAARRAARDEARHTRVATALAEREGAAVPRVKVRGARVRSLEAIALENAVEGCVRETFGAAVALAQSITAGDARVRAAMRRIGPDEMRHAELAWSVARWIEGRLDPRARARVARARRLAAAALVRTAGREVHGDLVARLGVPPARAARAIALELAAALWGAAASGAPTRAPREQDCP